MKGLRTNNREQFIKQRNQRCSFKISLQEVTKFIKVLKKGHQSNMIYEFIKYHIKTKYVLDRGQVWKNDIELTIIKIQYKKIIFNLGK